MSNMIQGTLIAKHPVWQGQQQQPMRWGICPGPGLMSAGPNASEPHIHSSTTCLCPLPWPALSCVPPPVILAVCTAQDHHRKHVQRQALILLLTAAVLSVTCTVQGCCGKGAQVACEHRQEGDVSETPGRGREQGPWVLSAQGPLN